MVAAALLGLTLPRLGVAQRAGTGDSAQRKLSAQIPAQGSAATNPELAAAMQALRPGHLVRISANGVPYTGRVANASYNQLAFRDRYPGAVPASSIDSLWVYKSNAGSGALIGAVVVGAASAFMGYAMSGMALDYEPSGTEKSKGVAAFGIVGGLVGGLFGGAIGSVLSHWSLVSPRR